MNNQCLSLTFTV